MTSAKRTSFATTRQIAMSLLPLGALGITFAAATTGPEATARLPNQASIEVTEAPPTTTPSTTVPTTITASQVDASIPPASATPASAPLPETTPIGANATCTADAPPNALHVDVDNGTDRGSGTASQPFATLGAAYDAVPEGGTVVVHPGIYRTPLGREGGDGWAPKQIHIMGAAGAPAPTISGTAILEWRADGDTWIADFANRFDPADVRRGQLFADHPEAAYQEQVFVDGKPLDQVIQPRRLDASSFHHDRWTQTISIAVDPTQHLVEVSTARRAALFPPEAAGSSLTCLDFVGFAPAHRDGVASLVIDADDMVLTDVTIRHSAGTGLGVFGERVTLERVTASNNGAVGASVHRADAFVVRNSVFDSNNAAGFQWIGCGARCVLAGMKITATNGVTVTGSRFQSNTSTGLWCDLGCQNVEFHDNAVIDNAKHGIFYEVSKAGSIHGNLIVANGGSGLRIPGSDSTTVSGNLFIDNETHLVVADDLRSPSDLAVPGIDTDPSDIAVTANVFADGALGATVLDLFNNTAQSPALGRISEMDRNCYALATATDRFIAPGVGSWATVEDFSIATGFEAAALVTDHIGGCVPHTERLCSSPVVHLVEPTIGRFC